MNRIFVVSEIDEIISTDREIIKSVLDLIDDIKKVAADSSSDASRVSSEAKKGDVSGAAATIKSCIDNDAYSKAKSKLSCVENNLKGINRMDKLFDKQLSKLTQSTNKIKGVIKELDSFIINTPLTTPASDYNAALTAMMTVWEKVLKEADSDIEAVKRMAKGAELFSSVFSSDPVNLSTGNFIYEKYDLEYSGRQGLYFKRFYNSVNDYEGILGKDWITNYEVRLSFVESKVFDRKEVSIIKEDGKEEIFLPVDEKRYTPQANSLAELVVTDIGFEYINLDRTKYIFDKEGILIRYENGNGLGYSLEYFKSESIENSNETTEKEEIVEKKSVLQKVIKDTGEYFIFVYSEDGYLKSVSDSEGRTVTYDIKDGKLISVTRPDGKMFRYSYSASGKLRGVEGPRSIITVENEYDQEFRVVKQHFPDGTTMSYEYDDENGIVTQTERNGAVTVHYHDEQMRNIKNVYPDGEESFVYNSRGRKTQIKDKNGNTTRLSYDNRGNITAVINPMGVKSSITYNCLNKPMTVSVDGNVKIHNSYDNKGNLLESEDSLGRKSVVKYDETGRPIQVIAPDGSITEVSYDLRGNISEIKDYRGSITKYNYDNLNRITEITDPSGAKRSFKYDVMNNITEETNAEGNTRYYKYNESGKVTEIKDYDGSTVKRIYNVLNKPEAVIDREGRETRFQYDAMWNLARVTAPDGGQTTFIYNENNRLSRIKNALGYTTRFTYDGMGNRLSMEDAEGNKTSFEYNAIGKITTVKDSEGYEIKYEYDNEGNLVKITDKVGNELIRTLDAAGQIIEEKIIPADCGEDNSNGGEILQGAVRRYTYDLLGNIASVTTETGLVKKYKYLPGTGKVTEIIYNDGNKETYTYNANGYVESKTDINGVTIRYTYDCMNRLIEMTGSDGESRKYTYDVMGNVISMTDVFGNVTKYEYSLSGKLIKVTDALGNFAEYTYDVNNRLIGINQQGKPEEPPRVTEYKRNLLGKVETVIDSLGQKENYKYNKRGELIEKIDKDGYITKYGYTSRGDIESLQYADGREVMLSYDAMRHLTEVKDWLGITKITKDSLGRTTEVTYPDERKVSYSYNSLNQRTKIIYPDGKQVKYIYDENARLAELKTINSLNSLDESDEPSSIIYSYNSFGRLKEKNFPNGTDTTYEYNDRGLLSKLTHSDREGILDEYIYSYDKAANKTGIIKNRRGLEEESGAYSYGYDAIGRLSTVSKDNELLRKYSYDAFSNRILLEELSGENAGVTRYCYDALNQLTEKTKYSTADVVLNKETYSYDKRGNLVEVLGDDQIKNKYVYGAINRLEEAVNGLGESAKYIYDGFGHRVGKEEYKSTTHGVDIPNPEKKISYLIDMTRNYHNMLERETETVKDIEEIEAVYAHNDKETFIWDGKITGRITDDKYDYYLKDELGSTIRLIDEEGEVEDSYGYDEFGNDLYDNQGVTQPFGYTGYQIDSISDTYYAQVREYDPKSGRFEGRDRVGGFVNDLFTQNRYTYCFNNSMTFVDQNGLWPTWDDVTDFIDDVEDTFNDVVEDIEDTVNDVVTDVQDTVNDVIEDVEDKVNEVIEDVNYVVDQVEDKVNEVVEDVQDTVTYIYDNRHEIITTVRDYTILGLDYVVEGGAFVADVAASSIPGYNVLKFIHYNRNLLNQNIPQTAGDLPDGWSNEVAADCHQYTSLNGDYVKWVSPDGHYEVIFDSSGNIVTYSEDAGTYNFCPSDGGHWYSVPGHVVVDLLPWIIWGNSEDDSTFLLERICVKWGGIDLYQFRNGYTDCIGD